MSLHNNVMVVTTNSIEGAVVKKYIKPVSAHLVAGTNLINDFFGSISDVFGGRSETYQKQLRALYNDAIDRIRVEAFEAGGNCVLGLHIDMDEISGKGKSMFMLTAMGTAVVVQKDASLDKPSVDLPEKVEVVRLDMLMFQRERKNIISKAISGSLFLNDKVWQFLTDHQVHEVFNALVKTIPAAMHQEAGYPQFNERFTTYVEALPYEVRLEKLYEHISTEDNGDIVRRLMEVIKNLHLFDFKRCMLLLQSDNFAIRKRGVALAACEKIYYNAQDFIELEELRVYLKQTFGERGIRTKKKQLLSSKEKDVWACECGKVNDMESYCVGCNLDISGFKMSEVKPVAVEVMLSEKIELLKEFIG